MNFMQSHYNAEIVAGALLPAESRIIARLELQNVPAVEVDRLLRSENILQKRSTGTSVRQANLIRKRFSFIDRELLTLVAEGSRQEMVQSLLVAAIKHSQLIGDFLINVVKEKLRTYESKVDNEDWERFLTVCEQIDPFVTTWRPSTRLKLRQVVKKCLVEGGYLESSQSGRIVPVLLLPNVKQSLLRSNENYVLRAMDLYI